MRRLTLILLVAILSLPQLQARKKLAADREVAAADSCFAMLDSSLFRADSSLFRADSCPPVVLHKLSDKELRRRARAYTDTLSAEFLDTVNVTRSKVINDYSMLGVNYGATFSTTTFNPTKRNRQMVFTPNYVSVMYTHYEKLFGYIQNFGVTVGMEYGHEGYKFMEDDNGRIANVDTATFCTMTLIDIPAMAQFHFSVEPVKFMVDLGIYGGYRHSIERSGQFLSPAYADKFRDYEIRWDYGLKGGVGVALMFDPIEIHLNCHVRWSWSSLYQPDYYSPYYYRFAYPLDIMASVGIHYQLTKRHGKTNGALRREAREKVYGKKVQEVNPGQSR